MTETLLTLDNVGVSFSRSIFGKATSWAIRGVSFELRRGESLGVVGRNGSGKSTLLKLLADIIEPSEGRVDRPAGIRAALLALKVGFLPHLSGRENAILSGMMLGMPKNQIVDCMDEIIEFSGLHEFIDDPLYTYSSGMKMRLAFSASYQFEPDILLLDELLGVGDATFKHQSAKVMRERIRSNATVIMVSHNTARLKDLCTRLIWLDSGTLRADGSPEEILPMYSDFVKQLRESGNTRLTKQRPQDNDK